MSLEDFNEEKLQEQLEEIKNEDESSIVEGEEIPEESKAEEQEPSIEETARTDGWRPKEEWDGDPDEWVDAKEFVARKPFYKAISKLNKDNKRLKDTQAEMRKHYEQVREAARKEALEELRAEFEAASEGHDVKKAIEVHKEIEKLEKEVEVENTSSPPNEVFNEWVAQNDWYVKDKELSEEASTYGFGLYQKWQARHNGAEPGPEDVAQIYESVSKFIKKAYPDKFKNGNRERPSTVDSGTRTPSRTTEQKNNKLPTFNSLPEDTKVVYRKLVKSERNPHGFLSHEEFMKDYIAQGGTLLGDK